jgi:hypothetical protein
MSMLKEHKKTEARSDRTRLRIFDCDVHPVPRQGLTSLAAYLPKAWQERFARKEAMHDGLNVPIRFKHPNGSVVRRDARTPDGGAAASNPDYLVRDLLETHGIEGALLNCFDAGGLLSAQASTEESIVLATAYNDYFIDEWLCADKRLKYAPAVATQDPVASAAEIRRVGKHAQVAAIFVPLVNMLMGHRYYWPSTRPARNSACRSTSTSPASKASSAGHPSWEWGRSIPTSSAMRPSRKWAWRAWEASFSAARWKNFLTSSSSLPSTASCGYRPFSTAWTVPGEG